MFYPLNYGDNRVNYNKYFIFYQINDKISSDRGVAQLRRPARIGGGAELRPKGILYILQSGVSGRYYVGSTTDLGRRLQQHNSGHTHTTRRFGKLKLVFAQEFESVKIARKIEKKIKSWKRKDFVEKIIRDQKINIGV